MDWSYKLLPERCQVSIKPAIEAGLQPLTFRQLELALTFLAPIVASALSIHYTLMGDGCNAGRGRCPLSEACLELHQACNDLQYRSRHSRIPGIDYRLCRSYDLIADRGRIA